ncbi:DMT family transporter [Xinfangfangia pollutisoli]|uniref:DMT family transporter n=1 Tax=Xinfangfangia pollutisoli TaxID=2865960 RepID=UPI001CD76121|nr:DMT family transporter [Xinfangfangia pollutisoli]
MKLSDTARGALLMNAAMAVFTLNDTVMKAVMQSVPMFQAMFLRGILATALLLLLAWHMGALSVRLSPRDRRFVALRALFEVLSTLTFFAALRHMPLANLSAIMQALPLVVTLAAVLLLGEKVGWRRGLAIGVGLMGVLIIIRPGPEGFSIWSAMGLLAVLSVMGRDLSTRQMSRAVPSVLVAASASGVVLLTGAAGMAVQGWAPVTAREAGLLVLAAGLLVLGYLTIVGAMRQGEIGAIAPFRYMALVWAILLGWLIFGTLPDALTLLGAGIVVASGIYALLRETRLRRRAAQASG